jgi:hypothetical protein
MAFVNLMQQLKAQNEKSEGTQEAKRRIAIGYQYMARLMIHLQKPKIIEAEEHTVSVNEDETQSKQKDDEQLSEEDSEV